MQEELGVYIPSSEDHWVDPACIESAKRGIPKNWIDGIDEDENYFSNWTF